MRILVTGATGQVGSEVVGELQRRSERAGRGSRPDVIAAGHDLVDVSSRDGVYGALVAFDPDIVIHCAAFTAVDACESQVDRAYAVNALGTRHVAEAARLVNAHVLYLSTDYVFDGTTPSPYREWDRPNPLSVYGASKLAGESELDPSSTIVRTSWVCGRTGQNMVKTVLRLGETTAGPLRFVDDQHGCPTIADDLARAIVDLALDRRRGIFHVTNQGATTWFEFVRAVMEFGGFDAKRVEPISTAELDPPRPAPRPANSVLDNSALRLAGLALLPEWRASTEKLVNELTH